MPNIVTHLSCPYWSQYTAVYCDTQPQPSSHQVAIQFFLLQYTSSHQPCSLLFTIHEIVLQYSFPNSPYSFPSHNTLCVLQHTPLPSQPARPVLQYTLVSCNTVPQPPSLQYKPSLLAIQFFFPVCNTTHPTTHPGLQYNFSITIQLGSSPNQPLNQFFFCFFTICFSFLPATRRYTKNIYLFFFSFSRILK